MTSNTKTPEPENLRRQRMPLLLTLPTEIHLLIFQHLDSIHTLCLLIQTCHHLHEFWHRNAPSICANRARAPTKSHHADWGCELALLQQRRAAEARVPQWVENTEHGEREDQKDQVSMKLSARVIHNNAIVYRAGENLISQLREENLDGTGMLRREPRAEKGALHPIGVGFRAEMKAMRLRVEERQRFEDAYYRYWVEMEGEGEGMRHEELDLRSLFLRKVRLRTAGRVKG